MLSDLIEIFLRIVLPVLTIIGLGALVERRQAMHVSTLVALNLYLFVPAYLFSRISQSTLSWTAIGRVGLVIVLPMAAVGIPLYLVLRRQRARGTTISALIVGGLFFNAGNFGIPLAELAFGEAGGQVQALVMMIMNLATFFVAYAILALAQGHGPKGVLGFFRLPFLYVVVAALVVRDAQIVLPGWLDSVLERIAGGMVPVALVTLGAQLATSARWPRWALIGPVLLIKLAVMPAVTALVVWALGLWPWPGALLILASAGPTAVNTLLLTLELEGDARTAADCVFWTTLFASLTVTLVLAVVQALGGEALPLPG